MIVSVDALGKLKMRNKHRSRSLKQGQGAKAKEPRSAKAKVAEERGQARPRPNEEELKLKGGRGARPSAAKLMRRSGSSSPQAGQNIGTLHSRLVIFGIKNRTPLIGRWIMQARH